MILWVLMAIGFIWGVVKVMQGGAAISRGEEGKMDIVGGLIIAAAPIIMYVVFQKLGMTGAAVDPTTIGNQGF